MDAEEFTDKSFIRNTKITDWIAVLIAIFALFASWRACSLSGESNRIADKANQIASDSNKIAEVSSQTAKLAKELATKANQIASESNEIARQSNQIAKDAIASSEKLLERTNEIAGKDLEYSSKIATMNAEVIWNELIDSYNEVLYEVVRYEKSQNLQRKGKPVQSVSQLEEQLNKLDIPDEKKAMYRIWFQKYQSLLNVAKQWEPFKSRLSHIDMTLPEAPRLPYPKSTASGSFSIR